MPISSVIHTNTHSIDRVLGANAPVLLVFWRQNAALPPAVDQTLDALGIAVSPADDGSGVQITSVDPSSEAADKGLKTGEKITSVNNQAVRSGDDIQKVLAAAKKDGRKKALFQIEDQNGNRFVALPIG